MRRKMRITLLVTVFTTSMILSLYGDDHIVREQVRTYMGRSTPPRTSEVWIGDKKVYSKIEFYAHSKKYL